MTEQIEQDLMISRALVDLYDALVFRGGTVLNKLFVNPSAKYSEDIDFVQRKSEGWCGCPHKINVSWER